MADIIKSYLVSLSANVDKASFDKFQSALGNADKAVASSMGAMAGNMLKFEIAGVGAFASVGFGLIGYIDKLAMADAAMKRTAQQNMMDVGQWRALQGTLSALGMTMDDVFRGTPEDRRRFHDMYEHMQKLNAMLGPGYEDRMMEVRRVMDQMSMLEADAEYFGMKFAGDLLAKLGFGDDGILPELKRLNDYVLQKMPQWSDELSTDIIPVLKDFWGILEDVGSILGVAALAFVQFEGAITGDSELDSQTLSFHNFATAVGDAAHQLAYVLHLMLDIEKILLGTGAGFVSSLSSGVRSLFGKDGDPQDAAARSHFRSAYDALGDWGHDLLGSSSYDGGGITKPGTSGGNADFERLLRGIAITESGNSQFNRDGSVKLGPVITAGSAKGQRAIGKYQFTPGTAAMLGINPYDAAQNEAGARTYLAQLLNRYHGDTGKALAAYGGAASQYSPQGQKYIASVEKNAGGNVPSIILNVNVGSVHNSSPDQVAQAARRGAQQALDEHARQSILETNGAYAQ